MTVVTENAELLNASFGSQLEAIYRDTNLQLVGSIGRGMIMGSYGTSDALPTVHRPNGEYRDIDVLDHTGNPDSIGEAAMEPLKLDFECNKWLRSEANGIWITFPGDTSISEVVRPEVFEPVVRSVGDIACRTYSAATQQKINRLAAFERPKDKQAFREYDDFIVSLAERAEAQVGDAPLPNDFYKPFASFRQAIQDKHPSYFWACRAGVVVNGMPRPLRNKTKQLGRPARRYFLT